MLATICGAAFFERTFWLTKRRFSLAEGWSWHARLPRSRPQHPSCGSQETNVLNTAHLLCDVMRSHRRCGNLDRKCWQFKSIYGVLWGDIRHLIVMLVGCSFSGYGLLMYYNPWSKLMQEIQFLEFMGGSNVLQAFPNYLICLRFIRISTLPLSSAKPTQYGVY